MIAIVRDITRRKEAEEGLARIAAIVESSDDAILGMTPEGIITEWNHGAEQLYSYTANEMIGRSVEVLIPRDHAGEQAHILDTIKGGGRLEHFDTVRIRKDGNHVHVSLTASPIRSPKGELLGISWIARDITGRKMLEAEAARAKNQAELYLDLMGHDISNMHQIILGHLELAHDIMEMNGRLEGDNGELIDTPVETLQRSAQLIENIQNIQKLRAGEYKFEHMDLSKVVAEAIEGNSNLQNRSVSINFTPKSDIKGESQEGQHKDWVMVI